MLDEDIIDFLHGGCALVVGSVDESGMPHAGRGHGLTVLSTEPTRVRLLLGSDDHRTLANLRPGAPVAICTADVPTLKSLQFKGRVRSVEPGTEADKAKQEQYAHDFTHDIHVTDGDPLDILQRWADCDVVACEVELDDAFDQTPGPSAGRRFGGRA